MVTTAQKPQNLIMEASLQEGNTEKRVYGLDIMRALAVLLVVFGHMLQHSKPPDWLAHFGRLGISGVEIFFVLSGFLIGGIIIDLIKKGKFQTASDLLRFWSRRWLRTLPLYYLFFFIYLRFDWTGPSQLSEHLDYLFFFQNFAWRAPDFFLLSWSLTIEEYFYLLFPFVFFLLHKATRNPVSSLKVAIGIFLLGPLALKLICTPYHGWDDFNFHLRMVTVMRLDSLMYGVAAVFIKNYYPTLWSAVKKWTALWVVLAAAASYYIYANIPGLTGQPYSRLIQTFLFPALSLSIALLLPAFDSIRHSRHLYVKDFITYISTVSYSLYLGHILVITLVSNALILTPYGQQAIEAHPERLYPIYLAFIMLLAPVTYYGWELPFMKLRDQKKRVTAPSSLDLDLAPVGVRHRQI